MLYPLILFIIPLVVVIMSLMVNFKINMNREKSSPFECGFDPSSSSRVPFSLRFFLLAVLFLVFDIEIVLILPLPLIMFKISLFSFILSSFLFILILVLGLLHEWNEGSLEWAS